MEIPLNLQLEVEVVLLQMALMEVLVLAVQEELVLQIQFQDLRFIMLAEVVVEKDVQVVVVQEQVERVVEEMVLKLPLHQEQLELLTLAVEQVVAVYFQMVYQAVKESL